MEKNRNNAEENRKKNNYDLKSDAVEALVNADSEETPEYSEAELNQYRSHRGIHLSETLKIVLIKAWFAGAVCYFFLWGLGTYISSLIDMLFILGVVMGMVTDILVNSVIRFIEKTPGENDKWMMFSKKGMMSFFLNILYSFVIIFCVYMLYNVINLAITSVTGSTGVPLGVEPILFGTFCMAFDLMFIGIKRLLGTIIRDAKNAAGSK